MLKGLGIFFGVFSLLWIIWYVTGGPLRSTIKYPLVKYNDPKGMIYATSSQK